jgi:hypothetical protein
MTKSQLTGTTDDTSRSASFTTVGEISPLLCFEMEKIMSHSLSSSAGPKDFLKHDPATY